MERQFITIDIEAAPERVASVIKDVQRWAEWTPTIRTVKPLGGGEFRVGSRVIVSQPKFPPAIWKATDVRPLGFTWVSSAPGMRVVAHHWVEAVGANSRVTLALEFHGLFGPWFGRRTANINRRYLQLEAEGLKSRSENPAYRATQRI